MQIKKTQTKTIINLGKIRIEITHKPKTREKILDIG